MSSNKRLAPAEDPAEIHRRRAARADEWKNFGEEEKQAWLESDAKWNLRESPAWVGRHVWGDAEIATNGRLANKTFGSLIIEQNDDEDGALRYEIGGSADEEQIWRVWRSMLRELAQLVGIYDSPACLFQY